ncbi:MAG: hypothetical protein ACLSAH_16000 [Bilophila wadsworthia]
MGRTVQLQLDITTDNVFNWGDPSSACTAVFLRQHREGRSFLQHPAVRNPKVDAIMEQAASEVDNEKRAKLYKEFQQIVMNDVPIYFMTTTAYHHLQQACRQRARVHLGLPRSVYGRLPEEVAALDRAGRGNSVRPGVLPDRGCSGRACLSFLGMGPRPIRNIRGEFL